MEIKITRAAINAILFACLAGCGVGGLTYSATCGDEVGIGLAGKGNRGGGYTSFLKYMAVVKGALSGQLNQKLASDAMASFPCDGVTDINPDFGPEVPNPFSTIDMAVTPYGIHFYLRSASGATLKVTSSSITLRGGVQVATAQLTTNKCVSVGPVDDVLNIVKTSARFA